MKQNVRLLVFTILCFLFIMACALSPKAIATQAASVIPPTSDAEPISGNEASETLVTQIDNSLLVQDTFAISPNGRRVAYMVQQDKQFIIVLDGQVVGVTDDAAVPPIFSPDSKHMAYIAKKGNALFVVLDGNPGKIYDGIDNPHFSADSQHVAYSAAKGGHWFVVMDGQDGKTYDDVYFSDSSFSPDSLHTAYRAMKGGKSFLVVDGNEGHSYDGIDAKSIFFSPDSQHLAYLAQTGNQYFVVADNQEGKLYDGIAGKGPLYSPDSQHLAYIAITGSKSTVVLDGKEGTAYDSINLIAFSPDSQHIAYAGWKDNTQWFVNVDGQEGNLYDGISEPLQFRPDSQDITYGALQGDKSFLIVGVEEQGPYDQIGVPIFSSVGRQMAYKIVAGNSQYMILGDEQQGPYDLTGSPVFSPDGRHLAYVAKVGEERFVVVDGKNGNSYDLILNSSQGGIYFDSTDSFHYLALRGDQIYLVTDSIRTEASIPESGTTIPGLSSTLEPSPIPISYPDVLDQTFSGIHMFYKDDFKYDTQSQIPNGWVNTNNKAALRETQENEFTISSTDRDPDAGAVFHYGEEVINPGEGVFFTFKYAGAQQSFTLGIDDINAQGDLYAYKADGFYSFAMEMLDTKLSTHVIQGSNQKNSNFKGNLKLREGTWYDFTLAFDKNKNYIIKVWDPNSPESQLVYIRHWPDSPGAYYFISWVGSPRTLWMDDFTIFTFDELIQK